jgi:pantetheine-phosphate adenylyltransferase
VDFDYELQMAQMNDRLFNDGVETVLLMSDPEYSYISSSVVKEVHSLGGPIQGLVPENIYLRMKEKLAGNK